MYLTRINWRDHEQEILAAANVAPTNLFIPESVKIDYSDAVCRYVIEGGPAYTDNVPLVFPQSDMARFLNFQTFVSAPIEDAGGEVVGTLCGASTRRRQLSATQLADIRAQARLIAGLLAAEYPEVPVRIVVG